MGFNSGFKGLNRPITNLTPANHKRFNGGHSYDSLLFPEINAVIISGYFATWVPNVTLTDTVTGCHRKSFISQTAATPNVMPVSQKA